MCGVVGFINYRTSLSDNLVITAMTESLLHRGPDGNAIWQEGQVALGHTRLAILDLTQAAAQPMMSVDQRYVISFNGEIYNFLELRRELQKLNFHFSTQSDTEVLLAGFSQWNVDLFTKLNGMFAITIWDRKEQTLTLSRDRYGIKPLYYLQKDGQLFFGSESKAIKAGSAAPLGLDKEALLEYFTFQNLFTARTFYQGVSTFPAGCYAQVHLKQPQPKLVFKQYWDFNFQEPEKKVDVREYQNELDRLFQQAVKRQLVSDVEVGSFLSGGVDSGSITGIASDFVKDMKTFTLGFDLSSASGLELSFDEREQAEHLSYLFQTEHYEMVLKAGDMERCFPSLVWHMEEPRVGQSYPNFYASKLASKFVKVALSGTGGDELFAGYPWRYYRAVLNSGFEEYVDKYYLFWQRLIPVDTAQALFSPIWADVSKVSTRDIFVDVLKNQKAELNCPEDYLNLSLYFEAKTFLHGLLTMEDKLSMAHGLETRVPFLDNDLVDFAMKCPARLKLNNLETVIRINENEPGKSQKYFQKTKDGKQILRDVMSRYVPQQVAQRDKQGFSAPDHSWFKGESIDFVKARLGDRSNPIYELMDFKTVDTLVGEHLRGKQNRRLLVWSLLYFSEWLRQHNV